LFIRNRLSALTPLKILHIAAQNVSGVPGQLVRAERELGFDSRLVTLFRDRRGYAEDLCLDLPLIDSAIVRRLKRWVSAPEKLTVGNRLAVPERLPPVWMPHSALEKFLVRRRDRLWQPIIDRAIARYGLDQYDVYQLDGGLDLTREPRFIPSMKAAGKKVICCYTGSDLRTRGVIPEIDALCDAVVSVEFDHLFLHPSLQHVFFPFDVQAMPGGRPPQIGPPRIGHAPTSRAAKGSEVILAALQRLAQRRPIEIVLIEKLRYQEALERKRTLSIFVDQIGDLGYGINALESLAMTIPTCSGLVRGFAEAYPDHPFVEITAMNVEEKLIEILQAPTAAAEKARAGRDWVAAHHDPCRVVQRIHHIAGLG